MGGPPTPNQYLGLVSGVATGVSTASSQNHRDETLPRANQTPESYHCFELTLELRKKVIKSKAIPQSRNLRIPGRQTAALTARQAVKPRQAVR
jgi:hypothetical protein